MKRDIQTDRLCHKFVFFLKEGRLASSKTFMVTPGTTLHPPDHKSHFLRITFQNSRNKIFNHKSFKNENL